MNSILVALLVMVALYLVFWPAPIQPLAWRPEKAPHSTETALQKNELETLERLPIGDDRGPESLAVDSVGRIYMGTEEGRIVRLDPQGKHPEVFAVTGGRPLGLSFEPSGDLIVADADKGLLRVTPEGQVKSLLTEVSGETLTFADGLAIAPDGTIYFTQASNRFRLKDFTLDLLEHRGSGRLISYLPSTGQTEVLLSGLQFPNGLAVDSEGAYLLLSETGNYRVLRYRLKGEHQGKMDVVTNNLPGFPDNLTRGQNNIFWIALYAPRMSVLDALAPFPFLRKMIARIPKPLLPSPRRENRIIAIDEEGKVQFDLHDRSATYFPITSALEHQGYLYLGSLSQPFVGRIRAPNR